ncbi:MAG TPA: PEP-CTERM sorting domain-containing protein [Anaerolineae bacterium]|nr:PEP-CTERM sorting domain-containing protein [Anaerolineae bacterium]
MRERWLRGMLLGASLALLLAGGGALAAGLQVTPDQYCFECLPVEDGNATASYTASPYGAELTLTGHDLVSEELCTVFSVNGEGRDKYCQDPPGVSPAYAYLFADCSGEQNFVGYVGYGRSTQVLTLHVEYGQWLLDIEQEGVGSDQVSLTLAEVCEAEFVPEPGTIALLGSGLAGLAGYATLRLRSG